MNILVTGSGGQLGHALRRASAASADRYFFTDVSGDDTLRLDITDREAVERFVREHAIGAVVNCAAYTDVERAEEDAERAELLNATAAGHLARAMKGVGGLLVHVSTDYVFDGTANRPCTEETPTAPRSVYGATKLHGEEEVLASGCRYVILRTAWLYSEYGRNFLRTMLRLTEEKEVLRVVFDQTGTPTYAGDLAEAIFDIVEHRKYEGREGIYHFSCLAINQSQKISCINIIFIKLQTVFQADNRSGKISHARLFQPQIIIRVGNVTHFQNCLLYTS